MNEWMDGWTGGSAIHAWNDLKRGTKLVWFLWLLLFKVSSGFEKRQRTKEEPGREWTKGMKRERNGSNVRLRPGGPSCPFSFSAGREQVN
mmetsp:Transcript_41157/g.81147  ORF Transcript_41157/g.81147 Transcript_41157/m.81147 type:complete len:90 (-) Transcript_41157:1532-1801(-)